MIGFTKISGKKIGGRGEGGGSVGESQEPRNQVPTIFAVTIDIHYNDNNTKFQISKKPTGSVRSYFICGWKMSSYEHVLGPPPPKKEVFGEFCHCKFHHNLKSLR